MKKTCLLHACCAPCLTHPVHLLSETYELTAFFYNPNIQPEEEYRAREEEIRRLAKKWNVDLIVGEYDPHRWSDLVKGLEEAPEGGARCEICYRMRLDETARLAKARGYDVFGTTLSLSPHKKASVINRIGNELAVVVGVGYHEADFKKKDGFKHSCQISDEEGLYRQDYCGCLYSRRKS